MSRLEKAGEEPRKKLLIKNDYNTEGEYNRSHKDVLSDGDDKGKEAIGGITDVTMRKKQLVKNQYNDSNEYNTSNM